MEKYMIIKTLIIENNWYSLLFLLVVASIIYLITLKVVLPLLCYLILKSPSKFDDVLLERKVLSKLVLLPSLIFIHFYSHLVPKHAPLINVLVSLGLTWIIVRAFNRFLLAVNDIYEMYPRAKGKPIKGFIQILQIVVAVLGGIIAISILIGKSPVVLLSGLGAMTAILTIVFKDTILSLVASIRIVANGLIEIGDWIEMPQYGADGDVIDIALHSIQIQNWDKTIISIPTHKLIEDSFKNWKGMRLAGGRRIMRNIYIETNSIKFCDKEMLNRFEQINSLKEYLKGKKEDIAAHNRSINVAEDDYINGRHLTNIGTFRAYVSEYIKNNPKINHNLITMVRQLQPEAVGIPIQIYAFTDTTVWVEYENIQSDIFDHLLAILPVFELRAFQYPTGSDIRQLNLPIN